MKYFTLTLLLLAQNSLAVTQPWFLSGSKVKTSKDSMDLNGTFNFLTGTADPSSTATTAPRGSMYCRTGGSGGTCYTKQDSGSSTNWNAVAAGPSIGDVHGPASSGDMAIPRYSDTSGKNIEDSSCFIDDIGNLGIGAPVFAYDTGYYGTGSDVITLGDPTFTNAQAIIFKTANREGWIYHDNNAEFQMGTKAESGSVLAFYPNDVKSIELNGAGDVQVFHDTFIRSGHNQCYFSTSGIKKLCVRAPSTTSDYDIELPTDVGPGGGSLLVNNGSGITSFTNTLPASIDVAGDVALNTLGKKFKVKEGANGCMGLSTLVAGTVTVSTTCVTTNSRIQLTCNDPNGGVPGIEYVSTRVNGVSFTIDSTLADTCKTAWVILDPS
jgi:hypothetical protein